MIRIEIEPVWRFIRDDKASSMLVLLEFLSDIRASGTISAAAERAQVSYRHAWNLIEKWSAFFEVPLVDCTRGRGTTLTDFGEKLVWARQRLQARLGPQLQNLAQELQSEINHLLPQHGSAAIFHATQGFAVSTLRELLDREGGVSAEFKLGGSSVSLATLANGACDLVRVRLARGSLRRKSAAALKALVPAAAYRMIGFVTREMGLLVKAGNPFAISSVAQLIDAPRFVNRDSGSATRLLFDQLLAERKIDSSRIKGYEHSEFTQAAVAAYVASGMADVSFGVEAAARQFGLEFVPLVAEDHFFVCSRRTLEDENVQRVLGVMRGEEFHRAISANPGYTASNAGKVMTVHEACRSPTLLT